MRRSSLSGRTVLVTGGAGFLGVHLAQALAARRARLLLQDGELKRRDWLEPLLARRQARFAAGELRSLVTLPTWREFTAQVDYVVHLGLHVPAASDPAQALAEYRATNLEPFVRLLDALPRRVRGICLASSVSIYGSAGEKPVCESDPPHGTSPYAQIKLAMERALNEFSRQRGVPVSVLRYATVYGPGEGHSPRAIPSFIRHLLVGQPPVIYGDGSDVHDYLYVRDAAEGTCLALEHLAVQPGTYNLGSGYGWTTRAIAEHIQRLMQLSLPPKHMPARGPRQCTVVDISRARERLGFVPKTRLEEGLAAEIAEQRSALVANAEEFWFSPRGLSPGQALTAGLLAAQE